ncbi:MAG: aminoacyl-tRNA hydrolase [Epsilonproteobacteria bacterium]|nr:aminoacyl-tRNA hydrolase [Campylobacterota bacterium]
MLLVVGLGNPGPNYEHTRHNIGFMVIDELIKRTNAQKVASSSFKGELYRSQNIFFLKPLTFMNLSGESIQAVKSYFKIDNVAVIHDDLDLPFGALRFKHGGGHGGHNGLKSADAKITPAYDRIRMGIGKPEHKGEVASYVLSHFSHAESALLPKWISHAADATEFLFSHSLEDTSSKYTLKQITLE